MSARLICATLVFACIAGAAPAQTVVGRESAAGKYNRLRDYPVRPHNAIAPVSPDVFGTAAVGAGVTFYDARFRVWGFSLFEKGRDNVWRPQRDFPFGEPLPGPVLPPDEPG